MNAIEHVMERVKMIKDFVDPIRGKAVHCRVDEIVETLQSMQGESVRVFEQGEFYNEATESEVAEREFEDTENSFIAIGRDGSVFLLESGGQQQHFTRIDGEEGYRIERHGAGE